MQRSNIFRIVSLAIVLMVGSVGVYSQSNRDSLLVEIEQVDDSSKVLLYFQLISLEVESDYEQALQYGQLALELAKENGLERFVAAAQMNMAIARTYQGEYELAVVHFEKGLKQFELLEDSASISMCLGNIGGLYQNQSKWREAKFYMLRSLKMSEVLEDSTGIATAAGNLGTIYNRLGQRDSAIHYYSIGIKMHGMLGNEGAQGVTLANLGLVFRRAQLYAQARDCFLQALQIHKRLGQSTSLARDYNYLGQNYLETLQLDSALANFERSLRLNRSLGNTLEESRNLHGIGAVNLEKGDTKQAFEFFNRALRFQRQLSNREALGETLQAIGEFYGGIGEADSSYKYLLEAMNIAKKERYIRLEHNVLAALSKTCYRFGNVDEARTYEKAYVALDDSLHPQADLPAMEKLRADYHATKSALFEKAAEVRQAENNRQSLVILALVLLAALLVVLMLVFRFRSRAALKSKVVDEREKGLKVILESDERIKEKVSQDLHDGLGQLLTSMKFRLHKLSRNHQNGSAELNDELKNMGALIGHALEEVRSISYSMMPPLLSERGLVEAIEQMLRLSLGESDLKYEFYHKGIDTRLPEQMEVNLYRVCQELVTNSLKHSGAQKLHVQLSVKDGRLLLSVEDDGRGFDPSESEHEGAGLINIKNRIAVLGGQIVTEKTQPHGQITKVRIPIKHE